MPTNLEVAQAAHLERIDRVAERSGLSEDEFEPLGRLKGKLTEEGIARLRSAPKAKLVLVTAITPTTAGEGKTTVTIGLTQGLNQIGRSAVSSTREPALGPIFGAKGGACGGGYSQVTPMEDINLFFNGDFPAIAAAHNLLSAMVDAHLHHGNLLGIDPRSIWWPRTVDMNDRALRQIVTGIGGRANGPVRETAFVITPASEVMAILCLSRSLADVKERLGSIVVGVGYDGKPRRAKDLEAEGAMAVLLKDALRPNIVQNLENGIALVHGGPFGNIAHGCSSLISCECGLGLGEFLVTEAGFASDLGAEKFLNILTPRLGTAPSTIVLVATIKALSLHGGGDFRFGFANLKRHLSHLHRYGPPVVVALNRFSSDSSEEIDAFLKLCEEAGASAAVADPFNGGGKGCIDLARLVEQEAQRPSSFRPVYEESDDLPTKLLKICKEVYGGNGVNFSTAAKKDLAWLGKNGFDRLPVCVAKTQYSLSDKADLVNAPEGFTIDVRELRLSAGAGFIVAICGDIMLMPGLGRDPAARHISVDPEGKIVGLY